LRKSAVEASLPASAKTQSMLSALFTGPMSMKLVCRSSARMYSIAKRTPAARTALNGRQRCSASFDS
jgi:hypothetical protein